MNRGSGRARFQFLNRSSVGNLGKTNLFRFFLANLEHISAENPIAQKRSNKK